MHLFLAIHVALDVATAREDGEAVGRALGEDWCLNDEWSGWTRLGGLDKRVESVGGPVAPVPYKRLSARNTFNVNATKATAVKSSLTDCTPLSVLARRVQI